MTIASGTFIWILIFWMLMPSTKGTMQFRVKTSLLVHLMTPLVIHFVNGIELDIFEPALLIFLAQVCRCLKKQEHSAAMVSSG